MRWPDLPKKWSVGHDKDGDPVRYAVVRDGTKYAWYWVAEVKGRKEISFPVYRSPEEALRYAKRFLRGKLVRDNPVSGVDNVVGTFVSEHPWFSALIGTAALGAAGWTGAYLMSLAIGPSKSKAIVPSTDTSSSPTSTSTSTTTSPSTSTTSSSTSSSSSAPAAPTFDAAKAVTVTLPSGGKEVVVGTSLQLADGATGQPVAGDPVPASVLGIGPGPGQFVALAPGTAKIVFDGYVQASVTIVVRSASGTAGVASAPKRLPPKRFGLRTLLMPGA